MKTNTSRLGIPLDVLFFFLRSNPQKTAAAKNYQTLAFKSIVPGPKSKIFIYWMFVSILELTDHTELF